MYGAYKIDFISFKEIETKLEFEILEEIEIHKQLNFPQLQLFLVRCYSLIRVGPIWEFTQLYCIH